MGGGGGGGIAPGPSGGVRPGNRLYGGGGGGSGAGEKPAAIGSTYCAPMAGERLLGIKTFALTFIVAAPSDGDFFSAASEGDEAGAGGRLGDTIGAGGIGDFAAVAPGEVVVSFFGFSAGALGAALPVASAGAGTNSGDIFADLFFVAVAGGDAPVGLAEASPDGVFAGV